jgi:acyl carrier protein
VLPDGTIAFLGRKDHQIKINGIRIELGEVEGAIERHPAVDVCVVQPWEIWPGEMRLAGYCVFRKDVPRPDLRAFLREKLPEAMIPAAFVEIDAMPLTPSGKIDRRALPPPMRIGGTGTEPSVSDGLATNADVIELEIARIYARALNLKAVGPEGNFFELGGDSMILVGVISEIEATMGISVKDEDFRPELFATVRSLTAYVRRCREELYS